MRFRAYFFYIAGWLPGLVISYQNYILRDVNLFGILTEAYNEIIMPVGELKFGIRLKPLGKEYYLDKIAPLDRFADFTRNVSGDLANDLNNFAEQVTADILHLLRMQKIDKRKLILFSLLEQTSGNIEVATIAENSFWSSRQINRYFSSQFGLTLKSYINVLKCCAAYRNIKSGDLNPDLGFYDQSHFIREIRKHTGVTPKILSKNEGYRYLQFNDQLNVWDIVS